MSAPLPGPSATVDSFTPSESVALHSFSRRQLDTAEPARWLDDCLRAMRTERDAIKALVVAGTPLPAAYPIGWTLQMIDEHFELRMDEADALSTLNLLAAAEAALRIDFANRAAKRIKDATPVGQEFRAKLALWPRIKLDEDILKTWRDVYPQTAAKVAAFVDALHTRHWLAHGRWWVFKRGAILNFAAVAVAVSDLESVLSASPAGFHPDPV